MSSDRYVKKCYDMLLHFDTLGYNNWASEVKHILTMNGFMYIWNDQNVEYEAAFMRAFDQRIKDQFLQTCQNQINGSSKLKFYNSVKNRHGLENYLDILKLSKFRHAYARFRLSCHGLEIEKGRYRAVERENRRCFFCPHLIEDKYHFMLICNKYDDLGKLYLQAKYYTSPNTHKFCILMSSKKRYSHKVYCYIFTLCKFKNIKFIRTYKCIICLFCILSCMYLYV